MENYMQTITEYVSANGANWAAAAVILVVGWFIALFVRWGVAAGINRTGFGAKAKSSGGNIGRSIGQAFFWVILLFALYQALSRLGMGDTLAPLNDLLSKISAFAPKLFGAALTFFIGGIVAKVAKNATQSTLEAAQVDSLAAKSGLTSVTGSSGGIAKAIGTLVFVIIIVPVIIAALGLLQIEAISTPLTNMLNSFTGFIPSLIGASIVLGLAIFIGKWIKGILQSTLPSFGFDNAINELGLLDDGKTSSVSPSAVVGNIAFFIAAILGLTAAVELLNIETLNTVFGEILAISGDILKAGLIIAIGVFVANFIGRMVTSASNALAGRVIKIAAIVLFSFMALSQLDFGAEGSGIVDTAFTYILGAGAFAAGVGGALAFGLGGREWAKSKLNAWSPAKKTTKK